MRGGIPGANDPCTKPQVCEACGDPKEAELTPTKDSSDSTSGRGMKAVSVEKVGQKKVLSGSRLYILQCLPVVLLCVQEL